MRYDLGTIFLRGGVLLLLGVLAIQIHGISSISVGEPKVSQPVSLLVAELTEAIKNVGSSQKIASSEVESPENINIPPPLTHRLRLRGTALLPEPFAWIEDRLDGQIQCYPQGATILTARLAEIGEGCVWLECKGIWTQLHLEGSSDSQSIQSLQNVPQNPFISLPMKSDKAIHIQPQITSGQTFEGLVVASQGGDHWLKRWGMREGDLIFSVNGHQLTSLQQSIQVIRKALRQPRLVISLKRDGLLHVLESPNPLVQARPSF